MKKAILFGLAVVLVFSGVFGGCAKKEEDPPSEDLGGIPFVVGEYADSWRKSGYGGNLLHTTQAFIIRSFDKIQFMKQTHLLSYDIIKDKYDESFFEENALIIAVYYSGSLLYGEVLKLERNENILTIFSSRNIGLSGASIINEVFALEVKKADIEGVTEVKFIENGAEKVK